MEFTPLEKAVDAMQELFMAESRTVQLACNADESISDPITLATRMARVGRVHQVIEILVDLAQEHEPEIPTG